MELLSLEWLAILGGAAAWTTFFSLFSTPAVRGWRNLGWLACYAMAIVMVFVLPWLSALATWVLLGIATGLIYFIYEVVGFVRSRAGDASRPSISTLLNGLLLWPIMFPEVIEYCLADLGILKAAGPSAPPGQSPESR